MTWNVEYVRSVEKAMRRIDAPDRERIRDYLERRVAQLDNAEELGEPLRGSFAGLWRYRVGDYRVICEIQSERLIVLVVRVGHRRAVYR